MITVHCLVKELTWRLLIIFCTDLLLDVEYKTYMMPRSNSFDSQEGMSSENGGTNGIATKLQSNSDDLNPDCSSSGIPVVSPKSNRDPYATFLKLFPGKLQDSNTVSPVQVSLPAHSQSMPFLGLKFQRYRSGALEITKTQKKSSRSSKSLSPTDICHPHFDDRSSPVALKPPDHRRLTLPDMREHSLQFAFQNTHLANSQYQAEPKKSDHYSQRSKGSLLNIQEEFGKRLKFRRSRSIDDILSSEERRNSRISLPTGGINAR